MLLLAQTARGQEQTAPAQDTVSSWTPLGPAPVDQAGTDGRGYVLPMEDSTVTAARSNLFSIHAVAANYFYREQVNDFLVTQRYETHTVGLGYRRGFKISGVPRFEIGGHLQLHQRNGGMLNGFIEGFENIWTSLSGSKSAKNTLRTQEALRPPLGTLIAKDGSPIYSDAGTGSGLGDVYVGAKMALLDRDPSSRATRVSARAGLNVAGRSRFSEGNFVGMGLSLDKKLLEWAAFHGDVRATRTLDSTSVWNLPLKRWAYGFSAGSELKLSTNSSFNLQIGGSSTPVRADRNGGVRQRIWRHHVRCGPPVPRWLAAGDGAFLRARKPEPALSSPLEYRSRPVDRSQSHDSLAPPTACRGETLHPRCE